MQSTTPSRLSVLAVLAALAAGPVGAQELTADQLIETLTAKTRSFDPGRAARKRKFRSFLGGLKGRKTRQITVQERAEVAKFVTQNKLPSIDLEIFFEYNSADITPTALPKLKILGQALSDKRLSSKTFLIAGHTDARGTDEYNKSLSEKRAEAVRQYLTTNYKINIGQLVAIGYGEEKLKSATAPESAENRRVQVATLAD